MSMEIRPDHVAVVRLADDPQFTAALESLTQQDPPPPAIVLELSGVRYLNSSNLAKLLRLRKSLIEEDRKLVLCGMSPQVASVFHVTGLDRVFVLRSGIDEALDVAKR
jgi:anti-sigma B factor antagonist